MTTRMLRILSLCAAIAFAMGPSRAAQNGPPIDPPPPPPSPVDTPAKPAQGPDDEQIQLGTELVNVPFNVADKKNKPTIDIRQDEVQVLEDGKPQEVFSFERQLETPITISLLVDTSGSQELTIGAEREAAYRFFEKVLRPDKDLASVVTFAKEVTLEQPLTASRAQLSAALNRARVSPASGFGRGGTAPTNPLAGGTSLYDAIFLASDDILKREAGRRVVILLTDGADTTSYYSRDSAIESAWRSEVIIYGIGIGDPSLGGINMGVLDRLSKETGGRAFQPRSIEDLDRAFTEIQNDLRQQYVVSYTPSNTARDGSFRKIEVRLVGAERKDLRVRHRRGYYAPTH